MKNKHSIPVIYHPSTVLALDDDPIFLNSIRATIGKEMPYLTEENPENALRYLQQHSYRDDALSSLLVQPNFDHFTEPSSTETFDVDFNKLQSELNSPQRFNKVTVAFIDQSMPKIDGLTVCRTIRNQNLLVKLVLLTGNAGTADAVDAFNEGIIDAYIPKDHPNLKEAISSHILQYSKQQFIDISLSLFGMISQSLAFLQNPEFLSLFDQIKETHHITEYYLLDSSCSFIIFDADGKASLLFVRHDNAFHEVHEFTFDQLPDNLLNMLEQRKGFPMTRKKEGYLDLTSDAWEKSMVSMTKIGKTDSYYALVDQPEMSTFSLARYFQKHR